MKTKKKLYNRQKSKKKGGSYTLNEELLNSLGLSQNNITKTMKQFDISLLSKNELLNLLQLSYDCEINKNYNGKFKKYEGYVQIYIPNRYNHKNLEMVDNLLLYLDYFDIRYIYHKINKKNPFHYNFNNKKIYTYYIEIFIKLEEYNKFINIMYSKYSDRCNKSSSHKNLSKPPRKIPNSLVLRRQ